MSRWGVALWSCVTMFALAQGAQAGIATYGDFGGYVIRNNAGSTATVCSDNLTQSFTMTALAGGKVALGTSAINGAKVSDFLHLGFSNSVDVEAAGKMVYLNFWVTDGNPNHGALIAPHVNDGGDNDGPIYPVMTSSGGMDGSYFRNLAVRAHGNSATNFGRSFSGAVKQAKPGRGLGGYGGTSRWKSSHSHVSDLVRVSNFGDLVFGSPFGDTTTPGLPCNGNGEWPDAGEGGAQTSVWFYPVCGDTSGCLVATNYTLSDIALEWTTAAVPEPSSLALCGASLVGLGLSRRLRRQRVAA